MAKAYYGSKLSKNMTKTPEGFLICKNVPIARTGVQKYLGRELGLDGKLDEIVKVYRIEEEVFTPQVFASFEGKVFTEEHPDDWVTPMNAQVYMKGAVTNVRRGADSESDLLLADIIVYNDRQIREIESREKREVSCGYECGYTEYKDGYKQINIIGNHVALVSAGRAGERVAIRDNEMKETSKNERRQNNMANEGYKLPRRGKVSDALKAFGLKMLAQDGEPEDIMEAVDELVNEKYDAEKAAEPVVIEKETPAKDEDPEKVQLLDEITKLRDTISELMNQDSDEEFEEEEESDGLEALDELEEELETNDDETEEVESVEEDPEVINDEEDPEDVRATTDSIRELASVMKQVVAAIPDANKRRKTSDALAQVLRKHAKETKDAAKNSNYSQMAKRTKDAETPNVDIGMEIAKKFNPHYKEK